MENVLVKGKMVRALTDLWNPNVKVHEVEVELPIVDPKELKENDTVLVKAVIDSVSKSGKIIYSYCDYSSVVAILPKPIGAKKCLGCAHWKKYKIFFDCGYRNTHCKDHCLANGYKYFEPKEQDIPQNICGNCGHKIPCCTEDCVCGRDHTYRSITGTCQHWVLEKKDSPTDWNNFRFNESDYEEATPIIKTMMEVINGLVDYLRGKETEELKKENG